MWFIDRDFNSYEERKAYAERNKTDGKTPVTFKTGGTWGDAINWQSTPLPLEEGKTWRVVGWKTPRPSKGDLLEAKMQSGQTLIFEFVEVDYPDDPVDMFFADVKPLRYKDE